jgi:hypothetical protein
MRMLFRLKKSSSILIISVDLEYQAEKSSPDDRITPVLGTE